MNVELQTHQIEELYPQYHRRPEDWYILQTVHFNAHVGTHIESPFHHRKDGLNISQIALDTLIGDAVKLDFTHKKPNDVITLEEFQAACNGIDLDGKIVFMHTGRDKFYNKAGGHDRPYPENTVIQWLLRQKIKCLAIDATGIEVKGLDYQPNHATLFSQNIPLVENVTNLESIEGQLFKVCILPINIEGLESCPVRVVAFQD